MFTRSLPRALVRSVPRTRAIRAYSESVVPGNPSKEWLEQRAAVEHHAGETTYLWRKLSFYVAVPTTILCVFWVRRVEAEHSEHEAHVREENGGEMPPVAEYDYLNKRARPFPWGMNSLFFNPHTNKNMEESADE